MTTISILNISLPLGIQYWYATIALAINTIKKENIEGNFAELGIFRGESSKIIHKLAHERILYLFDTFKGFPSEYLEDKTDISRFKDIKLDIVKKKDRRFK